tara:strand:+ start:1401 stop:2312 length:912 start_codon:yes stop_codon:yes gene_type:complete
MNDADESPWGNIKPDPSPEGAERLDGDQAEDGMSGETIVQAEPETAQPDASQFTQPGFQVPATAQTITTGDEKKGVKIPMVIAAVLVAVGLVAFVVGAALGASIEEKFEALSTEPYTEFVGENATLVYDDADDKGEAGWYLLIPGDPKADANGNGVMDACENVNIRVVDERGEDASERAARISCSTSMDKASNAGEEYYDIKDHIIVAKICQTLPDENGFAEHRCDVGEQFTITNDAGINMSVVDLDEMLIPFVEETVATGIASGGSFLAGCCSLCGGIIALVVGLMRLGGGKPEQQVQFVIN